MTENGTKPVTKPTKKWLLDQIEYLKRQLAQNEGALLLCANMLREGVYIEESEGNPNDAKV